LIGFHDNGQAVAGNRRFHFESEIRPLWTEEGRLVEFEGFEVKAREIVRRNPCPNPPVFMKIVDEARPFSDRFDSRTFDLRRRCR